MIDESKGRAILEIIENALMARVIVQGQLMVFSQQFQHRLGRPLTDAENTALTARFHALGHERLSAVVLDLDTTALAAWLADPAAI